MERELAGIRHTRQTRLNEVGEHGQMLLSEARVVLKGTGFAARVEERYLRGAGVGGGEPYRIGADSALQAHAEPLPEWMERLDPNARDVAAGAYSALATIRSLLRLAP